MSAISDKLKSTVQSVFDLPKEDIEKKVDQIVETTRQGGEQGEQVKKILNQIEQAEQAVKTVEDTIKTVKSVLTSIKAARKAAETTEKAATLGAALNPAAAAIQYAQKFVIEKVRQEEEEAQNVLNVIPSTIENFKNFISEAKLKLKKASEERKRKKALKEQRERKLNS
jgi:cell shape-determining protein MreC|tara:strand:- start:28 stop:534 length:507 start_codon:yes stop_codon:yes gene_type:complete